MQTRVLTMMLTYIKGFTQRTCASSREALGRLLDEHERILNLYPGIPEGYRRGID